MNSRCEAGHRRISPSALRQPHFLGKLRLRSSAHINSAMAGGEHMALVMITHEAP
jgi:hypothetical protein